MSGTGKVERLNPLQIVVAAAIGGVVGFALEFGLSARGRPPFVPPYSMSVALGLLAILLLVLGLRLKRSIAKGPGAVNPFHAVRLLATARAGQLVGALFLGFGAGTLLSLLGRHVPAPSGIWLPMLITGIAGIVLLASAIYAERCCTVPPGDDGDADSEEGRTHPGAADQPAFRDAYRPRDR